MPTPDYLAAEGPNHRLPFAGYQSTPLRAFGERGLLIPFRLSFDAANALLIKQASKYVFPSVVAGTSLRLDIPRCSARNVMVHITGQVGMTVGAITRTTAPDGYITIALDPNETEGELTGFIYLVPGFAKGVSSVLSGAHYAPRGWPIGSHKASPVGSPYRELLVAPYVFAVDGSGDPDGDTFYGPRPFAVEHTDDGEYTLPDRFGGPILLASVDDAYVRTTQDSPVILATDNLLAATDPGDGDALQLLVFEPVTAEDKRTNINSPAGVRSAAIPAPAGGEGNVRSAIRDGVFVPFMVRVTGGAIVEATSFVPNGARVSIASGTARIEVGGFSPDRFFGQAVQLETGLGLALTVVDANDGVVSLAPGANGTFTGWILASSMKQR